MGFVTYLEESGLNIASDMQRTLQFVSAGLTSDVQLPFLQQLLHCIVKM